LVIELSTVKFVVIEFVLDALYTLNVVPEAVVKPNHVVVVLVPVALVQVRLLVLILPKLPTIVPEA